MAYDNTNSGAVFVNGKKSKETDPDRRGSLDVEGVEYWVSEWDSVSKKTGEAYVRIKINRKESTVQKPPTPKAQGGRNPSFDDIDDGPAF